MNTVASSRRNVMRALAIVPAVIAAPAAAAVTARLASGPAQPSHAMAKAIADYHNAVKRQNEWEKRVYSPAWKACQAAEEKIPHFTTENSCALGERGALIHISTDNPGHLSAARVYKQVTVDGHRLGGDISPAMEEFWGKLDWREAEKKRIHKAHNMDALDEEQDQLEVESSRAMTAVDTFPVTTLADLIAKTEFGKETDGQIDHDELLADLRRIAREAVA